MVVKSAKEKKQLVSGRERETINHSEREWKVKRDPYHSESVCVCGGRVPSYTYLKLHGMNYGRKFSTGPRKKAAQTIAVPLYQADNLKNYSTHIDIAIHH